jgi:hypothetical protein
MKEMGAFLVFAVSLQCAAAAVFPLSHPSKRFSSPLVQMVLHEEKSLFHVQQHNIKKIKDRVHARAKAPTHTYNLCYGPTTTECCVDIYVLRIQQTVSTQPCSLISKKKTTTMLP